MELFSETDELEIFDTDTIQHIVEYKWTMYGRQHHILGMAMHMFYTLMIIVYVSKAYLHEIKHQQQMTIVLFIGVLYPAYYDMM